MVKKLHFCIVLLFGCYGFSQEKIINGKIKVNALPEGIKVENIHREISVQTDTSGNFSLIANAGEILIFSSINIENKVFLIKDEHFDAPIEVELKTTSIEIEEVEIGETTIKGFEGKKYTPAERRYQSGGKILKMNQGFEFNLEAIGNAFSGKRKQLKKELEIEKTQKRLLELDAYIDQEFYWSGLGLITEEINKFKYFLVDDKSFLKVLDTQELNIIILEVLKKHETYKQINHNEN